MYSMGRAEGGVLGHEDENDTSNLREIYGLKKRTVKMASAGKTRERERGREGERERGREGEIRSTYREHRVRTQHSACRYWIAHVGQWGPRSTGH